MAQGYEKIKEIMNNFKIINIYSSSENDNQRYATLQVRDNLYDVTFSNDLEIEDKIIEWKTKSIYSFEQLLDIFFAASGETKEIQKTITVKVVKTHLSNRLEVALSDSKILELESEIEIEFTKFEFGKIYCEVCCKVLIFDKSFEVKLLKKENSLKLLNKERSYTLSDSTGGFRTDNNPWFFEELFKREIIKENGLFYKENKWWINFNISTIIGGLIVKKFSESNRYKMLSLYNPIVKKFFEEI
jgi:hypothetical protein